MRRYRRTAMAFSLSNSPPQRLSVPSTPEECRVPHLGVRLPATSIHRPHPLPMRAKRGPRAMRMRRLGQPCVGPMECNCISRLLVTPLPLARSFLCSPFPHLCLSPAPFLVSVCGPSPHASRVFLSSRCSLASADLRLSSRTMNHSKQAQQTPTHVSPAMRIYRHALESILGMLKQGDLVQILAVSRSWAAAVRSLAPINALID